MHIEYDMSEYQHVLRNSIFSSPYLCVFPKALMYCSTSLCFCFQNAMRATNELHEGSKEGLPLIKAKVTLGKEDLSVKVSLFANQFSLQTCMCGMP